jgi:hypothetical protein
MSLIKKKIVATQRRPASKLRLVALIIFSISLFFVFLKTAEAATITEIFLLLPPEQTRGLSNVDKRALLDNVGTGAAGYPTPSQAGYWLDIRSENTLTLFSIRGAPIVYKVFPLPRSAQLLVICRSRQTYGPANANELPHETYLDLVLYTISPTNDLIRADIEDYLPEIGVWDYVTSDTVTDRDAIRDLQVISNFFDDCLTCHASVQDNISLDIMTVTSINGHSCAFLMPQFKLLPLRWEGDHFTKPYDRAARPERDRAKKENPHGIYYHEPGK